MPPCTPGTGSARAKAVPCLYLHERVRHVAPLEVVGEVPRADVAGLEPDQRVVAGARSVRFALLGTEIPHSDLSHEVALGWAEHGSALQLDPAIRRLMLVDEHCRPRIVPQVP